MHARGPAQTHAQWDAHRRGQTKTHRDILRPIYRQPELQARTVWVSILICVSLALSQSTLGSLLPFLQFFLKETWVSRKSTRSVSIGHLLFWNRKLVNFLWPSLLNPTSKLIILHQQMQPNSRPFLLNFTLHQKVIIHQLEPIKWVALKQCGQTCRLDWEH